MGIFDYFKKRQDSKELAEKLGLGKRAKEEAFGPAAAPKSLFSGEVYDWMKDKQLQKYEQLFPRISKYLDSRFSVLDIGIGRAWLEKFLEDKGITFRRIVGTDVDENMIMPRKVNITYYLTRWLETGERFDFVICFDSAHLLEKPERVAGYCKPGGLLLISLPSNWKNKLSPFREHAVLEEGEIGDDEKDYFILLRVTHYSFGKY